MLRFDLNKFSVRAVVFGLLNFILILLLGFVLSGKNITDGYFIIYPTIATAILGAIFEPVMAIIQKRRINGPELIGAAWLGVIVAGFLCAGFCILCGIIH